MRYGQRRLTRNSISELRMRSKLTQKLGKKNKNRSIGVLEYFFEGFNCLTLHLLVKHDTLKIKITSVQHGLQQQIISGTPRSFRKNVSRDLFLEELKIFIWHKWLSLDFVNSPKMSNYQHHKMYSQYAKTMGKNKIFL